MKDYKPTER